MQNENISKSVGKKLEHCDSVRNKNVAVLVYGTRAMFVSSILKVYLIKHGIGMSLSTIKCIIFIISIFPSISI